MLLGGPLSPAARSLHGPLQTLGRREVMFVARWSFSTRIGRVDDCVGLLRKWEVDVGERIGWKVGSVRLMQGVLGPPDTAIEFETRFECLSDLESAWADMDRSPHHREYLKQLDTLLVPGTSQWAVYREMKLAPKEQ
jgi:hypothetical protein